MRTQGSAVTVALRLLAAALVAVSHPVSPQTANHPAAVAAVAP
ncbi:hypothetical protein [Rhizobium oryzihabitans]|nr:hypothetical protein [Rhizobium oryzihabitans]